MRKGLAVLFSLVLMLSLTPFCSAERPGTTAERARYTLSVTAEGYGLSCEVTLAFTNTGADGALTARFRDIALDGEGMSTPLTLTADPGRTETKTLRFRRSSLRTLTAVETAVEVTDAAGASAGSELLAVYPLGVSGIRRVSHYGDAESTVILDNQQATVLLYRGDLKDGVCTLDLWFFNKTDDVMRLRPEELKADGRSAETDCVAEALPGCGAFAQLAFRTDGEPVRLGMKLAGYLLGRGGEPVFREDAEYSPADPKPVATLVPDVTPSPVIGTVTIRKSGAVNVRADDNTGAKKIGSAKAGHSYPCLGISKNGWYLIRLEDGTEGYVTNTLTTLKKD